MHAFPQIDEAAEATITEWPVCTPEHYERLIEQCETFGLDKLRAELKVRAMEAALARDPSDKGLRITLLSAKRMAARAQAAGQ